MLHAKNLTGVLLIRKKWLLCQSSKHNIVLYTNKPAVAFAMCVVLVCF